MNLTEEIKDKMYELYLMDANKTNDNNIGIVYNVYTKFGFLQMSKKLEHYHRRAVVSLREKKLRRICSKLETK
jgi:hypothetical protein